MKANLNGIAYIKEIGISSQKAKEKKSVIFFLLFIRVIVTELSTCVNVFIFPTGINGSYSVCLAAKVNAGCEPEDILEQEVQPLSAP